MWHGLGRLDSLMRDRSRAVEAAIVISLLAAACGDGVGDETTTTTLRPATTTTTQAPAGPQHGGEVIVGLDHEPPTLNPLVPGGDNQVVTLIGNAYLVGVSRIDPTTLERIPDVVTELPTVANGGITVNDGGTMTVRYRIVEEAVWADGMPISGDDFLFTYETHMREDLHAVGLRIAIDEIIPESVTAGPKTFEYTLREPSLLHESLFAVVLPRHHVEGRDFLDGFDDAPWVSGGPFVFDEWRKGSFLRVVRNPRYWRVDDDGGSLPYLDGVLFRFIPEVVTLLGAFADGEVEVVEPPPAVETIERLQALEGVRVQVLTGSIWEHLAFSFSENSLARNPNSYSAHLEYRRAVAHAVDRSLLVDDAYRGLVPPMDSYLDAFGPGWSSGAWARYAYDPQRARDLVAALCDRDDTDCDARPPTAVFTTTLGGTLRDRVADLLVPMFAEAGIDLLLELEPSTLFFGDTLDTGRWDLGMWAWVATPGIAGVAGIHDIVAPSQWPPRGQNYYRWGTPAVVGQQEAFFDQGPSLVVGEVTERTQALWEAMQATVDEQELRTLVSEMEDLLADQVVFIPLFQRPHVTASWADRVAGIVANPSQSGLTWNVETWFRLDLMG